MGCGVRPWATYVVQVDGFIPQCAAHSFTRQSSRPVSRSVMIGFMLHFRVGRRGVRLRIVRGRRRVRGSICSR
nr:MAG TPA: hypothetical protein [Caudoviricetes sp.]